MIVPKPIQRADNFELSIKAEKGFKQVLLRPQFAIIEDPGSGVIRRGKNVMRMDRNAALQASEKSEILMHDVALRAHDVRRVNEKNVVRLEPVDYVKRHILDA